MKANHIKASRVRSIGPREAAFMRGEPLGDFEPEPFYLGEPVPLEARAHTYSCDCPSCRECLTPAFADADPLPFVPDPQHSCVYGSEWTARQRHRAECAATVLAACAVSLATMALVWALVGRVF